MAAAENAHVLYQAVALVPHQGLRTHQTLYKPAIGLSDPIGLSRKGPYRLAKTLATSQG